MARIASSHSPMSTVVYGARPDLQVVARSHAPRPTDCCRAATRRGFVAAKQNWSLLPLEHRETPMPRRGASLKCSHAAPRRGCPLAVLLRNHGARRRSPCPRLGRQSSGDVRRGQLEPKCERSPSERQGFSGRALYGLRGVHGPRRDDSGGEPRRRFPIGKGHAGSFGFTAPAWHDHPRTAACDHHSKVKPPTGIRTVTVAHSPCQQSGGSGG